MMNMVSYYNPHLTNQIANDLINFIYPSAIVAIPIAFAIFNFTYKERKDISYQTLYHNSKIRNFTIWALVIINCAIYLWFYIESKIKSRDILITNSFASWLVTISFSLLIVMAIVFSIQLWKSINIFKIVDKHQSSSTKKIKKIQLLLENKRIFRKKCLKRTLNSYSYSNKILGQALLSQVEHNLTTSFSRNLTKFFDNQKSFFEITNMQFATEILEQKAYHLKSSIYHETLDINLMILDNISKSIKQNDIEIVLFQYNSLIPGLFEPNEKIYEKETEYIEDMHKLSIKEEIHFYKNIIFAYETISHNKEFETNNFLNEFLLQANQSDIYLQAKNIFTIYYVLILKSVYSNNLRVLTNFVNLAIVLEKNERINNVIQEDYTYNKSLGKLLIVAILKSLELGHNNCTGFLVKVAVNHQIRIDLNSIIRQYFNELKEQDENNTLDKDVSIQSDDVNDNLLKDLKFKVHISSRSWDYCYYKMVHLISKQQVYMMELGLLGINHTQILYPDDFMIDKSRVNNEYMERKLLDMSEEYGMIALQYKR